MVPPGDEAQPFVDFREEIQKLSGAQKTAVMGKANLQLVEAGVVEYSDVVTSNRIRDFREVVSLKKLSVERMVDAGVSRLQAEKAFETVHTPAHELAESHRAELTRRLLVSGLTPAQVREAAAGRLAARVTIGKGPSGPQPSLVETVTPKPPKPPGKPFKVSDESIAAGAATSDDIEKYAEYLGVTLGPGNRSRVVEGLQRIIDTLRAIFRKLGIRPRPQS